MIQAADQTGHWCLATRDDTEPMIAFLRAERGKHRDHAYVPTRAVVRIVGRGGAYVATDGRGIAGIALTNHRTLWNLIVREDLRGSGLGSEYLRWQRPDYVRIKVSSDKRIGDPTGFYLRNGYWVLGPVRSTMGRKTITLVSRVQLPLVEATA